MKIKIITPDIRISMPVPATLIGSVIKWIPDRIFIKMRESIPEPYCILLTKENVSMVLEECLDILRKNKGMEIVHVEARDGTFISIML